MSNIFYKIKANEKIETYLKTHPNKIINRRYGTTLAGRLRAIKIAKEYNKRITIDVLKEVFTDKQKEKLEQLL